MSITIKKNVIHLEWSNDGTLYCSYNDFLSTDKLNSAFIKFNPTNNAKIFIDKGVNLPRVKLRAYVKNQTIALTTKLDNADIVITTRSSILDNYTKHQYYNWISVETLNEFKHLLQDPDILNDYPYTSVSLHWHVIQELRKLAASGEINNKSRWAHTITDIDNLEILQTKTLCYPDTLISSVQEDGVVIDYDYYKQLNSMINSSDDDNLILAMELMANSYYDKSAVYLLTLFYEHRYSFEQSSKKNHVNFKGLLDYFGLSTRSICMSLDKIITELINKKVLTKENMDILTELVIKPNAKTHVNYNLNLELIRPSILIMDSPEFVKAFGSSYVINIESND